MFANQMSKDKEKYKSVFNVSVVGLSGTEQVKGSSGVGKSCLCNRFVRPIADDYYPDHTSALSQGDFSGRVVSNDMFLYWGDVTKTDDNGLKYKFNVVEQTEFVDDQSYQPHRSSTNQPYYKRSASVKLSSAEKLMYICTDQLGIESDFLQKQMPEGKLSIDGFILCFDVSHVTGRTTDDQVKFIQTCYHYLSKTKKPIVLALTKCDERVEPYAKEAEKFACSPGGKKSSIPIVETSAEENINVELAFMVLAQMIDKARSKSKIISYDDASKVRKEILDQAQDDLTTLLSEVVTSYHETWSTARKNLESKQAYKRYVELLGKNFASKIFRKHVNRLREEYRMTMQSDYLRYLPRAFRMILPDLSLLGATWQDSISVMTNQPAFDSWFIALEGSATPWYENDHVHSLEDCRIPFELLRTAEAENAYLVHRKNLEMKQHKQDMKKLFRETLRSSPQAKPGREWGDVVKYFKQYDFLTELNESELSTIYEQFQAEITEKAKQEFQELLYEKAEVFVPGSSGSTTRNDILFALEEDERYVAMSYMEKDRDDILTQHISSVQYPSEDDWGSKCLKNLVSRVKKSKPLEKTPPSSKWQLKPDSKTLNVVLLGADGLSIELANEITVQSSEDSYNLDGCVHSLRLRCIDGDVTSPPNSFKTSNFSPHGCIAVYSSMESLNYIQKSLRLTVMQPCDGKSSLPPPFQGLPVSILLASQACSDQQVTKLRSEGEHFAALLGCPFIDVMEPEYAYNRRFHETQIKSAMRSLINGIKERAGSNRNVRTTIEISDDHSVQPDITIVACTMADDCLGAEVALLPLLNHSSCKVLTPEDASAKKDSASSCSGDDQDDAPLIGDTLVVETYLGNQRRRIQVTMTSYQSARHFLSRGEVVHGFLLLFDTGRLASFSMMKAFANNYVSAYPIQIVCMSSKSKDSFSNSFFRDGNTQRMVIEANKLADSLQARFMTITPNHTKQTEVYTTFFKDAWEHKDQTEAINDINRAVVDGLDGDFSGLSLDFSKSSQTDENSSSRPITPEKSFGGPSAPATSSTESIPTFLTRPSVLSSERSISSPISDVSSLSAPLSKVTPASPAAESESSWNLGADFRQETPDTSPTAGLLDNEEGPAFREYATEYKSSSTPNSQSNSIMPGKLNPELLSKVEAGMQKPRSKSHHHIMHQKSFTEGMSGGHNGHGLPYFDPKKTGQRVLPQLEVSNQKSDHLKEPSIQSLSSPHSISKFFHSKHSASSGALVGGIIRRPTPYKNAKKNKGGGDGDSTDGNSGSRPNRYSTAGILETKTDVEPGNMGIRRGTSHELLHPSMPGYKDFAAGHTPKEEKLLKQKAKDEEKKRRDEEKRREKDQQKRLKEKPKNGMQGKQSMATMVVPNNHTVSEYFNKRLDDIIQGLNHMTPLFVEKCVRYIEEFGISFEGLYRIPANAKERENILRRFDEDNSVDLSSLSVTVQTVAGCLTWFFSHKNLPEPLIPYSLHEELEEAIGMQDATWRNQTIRGVIRKLPRSHYATFKYICTHLNTVCKHESENKMNSENIAICWWPTLFRPDLDEKTGNFKNAGLKDVLLVCIEQCSFMFYNQTELRRE